MTSNSYDPDVSKSNNMEKVQKSRLITAVKTPYTSTGRIDLNQYDKIVQY